MNMMSRMVIAVFAFFVAFQCCAQFMATRSIGQALYSVVYVTVPNSTIAQQIARYITCLLCNKYESLFFLNTENVQYLN